MSMLNYEEIKNDLKNYISNKAYIQNVEDKELENFNLKGLKQKMRKIEKAIEKVGAKYKNILLKKYILGYSIEKIAHEEGYSIRQMYRIHRKAIKEYIKLYNLE